VIVAAPAAIANPLAALGKRLGEENDEGQLLCSYE
jgi:hypothetical protein